MDISNSKEAASRIRALREDIGLSMQEMAEATGRPLAEYAAQESGERDLSFTFLHKCAKQLGVDVIELLTGESPHLSKYSVVRAGEGLAIRKHEGLEYLHKAPSLKRRIAEPFLVTQPYVEEEQTPPYHFNFHEGQEINYVISGHMRLVYEDTIEDLGPGDMVMYDSSRGHANIAIGGEPVSFLAIVIKPEGLADII